MNKAQKIDKVFRAIAVSVLFVSVCLLVKACVNRVQAKKDDDYLAETVYIVYTDENSRPYAVVTNPRIFEPVKPVFTLTQTERETVARIVAGQAGGKSVTCQTMIANVMYNQMIANGNQIDGTDYAKCSRGTPDDETYEAVDAIFTRWEWLLDDTVLWTGDEQNPDAFHQSLRLVTTQEGIAFYEVA